MITKDNVIEFRKQTAVTVHVHEDAERYTLEIEFNPIHQTCRRPAS